ncbi:uncharacterized protein LOC143581776 [Bidens hawaiensis]|uniref:uncharacterized protein LOC143581776 n=1 Tax=Bidens hawaiensis TaxID=980011 RepID=UPI00404A24DA
MMGSSRTTVDEDDFDSFLDMPLSIAGWEEIHPSVAQGVPEPMGNPRGYSMNPNSLQNTQFNLSSNTANTNLLEFPLLSDWNMGRGQQYMNQGCNESSFECFNRPQVNRDVAGSSFLFSPRDTAPANARNNVGFSTNHSGAQGEFEGSFLSLGLGDTSKTVPGSQLDSREISYKRKDATLNELKIDRARKATSQTFDGGFMGSQSNNSGFSNQTSHVSRMSLTNSDGGFMGSSPHILQMQQNDRQVGRADKLTEAASTELKMVHARKAACQTLDADFMDFQRNNSGFSNHSTLNSMPGSSRNHVSQMQQSDSRNIRFGDLDSYKRDQLEHSGTFGGSSAHLFNSQQQNLKPREFAKPSWMSSCYTSYEQLQQFCSKTVNSPNDAEQVISQNASPSQVLGGNLFSQRTTPWVSWVGSGPAGTDAPFPKRLGVESSARNSPRSSQGHLSSLQTTNPGGIDGAPVSYPVNYQEPYFTYGQSKNAMIQLPKGHQEAPSTNTSSIDSQPQKFDFHVRPHHKRTAVAPQLAPRWVQRQKINHPTVHHSMPKPYIPVTTAGVHSSIPPGSRTQPAGSVTARVPSVVPCVSNVKPRVSVASASSVCHIKWKDPGATSKLSGHRCFLCKRDLALTSEGSVFQPAALPPIAILPCGHTFHDQCLQNITPDDQAKDPPCIPCAIGES